MLSNAVKCLHLTFAGGPFSLADTSQSPYVLALCCFQEIVTILSDERAPQKLLHLLDLSFKIPSESGFVIAA